MKRTRTDRRFSLGERIVAGVLSVLLPLTTLPDLALALPHGGVVAKGQATLGYSTGRLLITQTTSSATFDWGSFNVTAGQSVVYKTPGSSSVSMNEIGGTTPSSIDGRVTSNGILYFMNPNGLIFGSGSVVSAAGVMAFGAGTPWGKPTGAVSNAGVLTATDNGTVALVGTSVTNTGTIMAPGGEVLLAAGSTVTPITATDGSSLSVATTGGGLVDDSGILSAETANGKTGTILLQSGMGSGTVTLENTAILDANAPNGGNGGQVVINASGVVLNNVEPINVSAPYGTNGAVKTDPDYILSGTTLDICNAAGLEYLDGNQSSYLSDTIKLESNMNLANGSTPYSWIPLGNSTTPFTGTFNGNGYVVRGYTIGTSSNNYSGNDVGFIGDLGPHGVVKNLGVSGTIYATNGNCVGGIVGDNNTGIVESSYNTGGISSNDSSVGGVVGFNNYGTVKTSYNTGSVSGSNSVGGIAGNNNSGTVESSYNTGSVSGSYVGGVVGYNSGTLKTSYNTGSVSGNGNVGGVVGDNCLGKVTDTYYNSTIFPSSGIGSGSGSATGLSEGTSSGALGNSGSYSGWSFASGWNGTRFGTQGTWIIGTVYPNGGTTGISAPILVPDLPTATVTGNSGSSVYSGSTVSPGYTTTYTMGGTTLSPNVTVTTAVGPNAGTYKNTPTYSISAPMTQTSVDSVNVVPGKWTINPAPLTFSGSISNPTKTYDGTTTATLTPTNSSATLTGFVDGQEATYTGATGSYSTPNAGTGISVSAMLGTGDFSTSGSGFIWSNYSLPTMTLSGKGTITPLSVTATANPATMTYGGSVPSLSGTLTTTGPKGGLANLSATWTTPATSASNVGSYAVTPSYSYLNGAVAGDFSITPAASNATALTITASPQIVPEYQTVFGFDNVVTPSESPAATSSSGSSPSPVPSGSATTLSASGGTTLMLLQPMEDGMTGEGILSDEPVTPSNQP